MTFNTRKTGSHYEDEAAEYLKSRGMRILARNYYTRVGELDVVALDGETLVFIEVKYRAGITCGDPVEAVGPRKQQKIRRVAQIFMNQYRFPEDTLCRFDVVAINGDGTVAHYKNAFGGI